MVVRSAFTSLFLIKQKGDEILKKKVCGLYLRVSTEDQAREGFSLPEQKRQLEDFCRKNNLEIYDYYEDAGISAKKGNYRPEFERMKQDALDGKINAIVAIKLDRFSRSVYDWENIIKFLEHHQDYGVDIAEFKQYLNSVKGRTETVSFEQGILPFNKFFTVEINNIMDKNNFLGILILFKDITQHKQDIQTIQNNQDMLMEKERLASLGQLIGGISHNLKTPIMSISGAAEGLTDLINEYDASIGDPEVTNDDHHAIANDMREWITKIHSYTAYMSDIITAVKGQAVNLSENENNAFTVDELFKRVNILMKHEISNASLTLTLDVQVPSSTTLVGDINSLVQVINNLITNAIQSYNGRKGEEIKVLAQKLDNNLIISVIDHGCGMTKEVQDKLFNTMITTKGKNGTGLGMFMSYSTIKGHFNGDITFETEVNKGTTFNVILPLQ